MEPTETEVDRLITAMSQSTLAMADLSSKVDKLNRVLLGAEDEGVTGIVARLGVVEKKLEKMWWTFPLLVLSGTALGQVAARAMGL